MNISKSYNRGKELTSQWMAKHSVPESAVILITAIIVGIGAGFGAVLFRWMINTFQKLSFENLGNLLNGVRPYHLLIIPAVGGAIFGPLIYFFAREAKGHGVPEVMEAVALHGGRIRPRVAVIKSIASALCIGTGGSVGREGPIAQIGSALGSSIGQWLKLSDERIRNLVACGAGGGIAATFNAPIAGAVFALEVILGQFHTTYFGAVVISTVTADVIANLFMGNERAFIIPEYSLVNPWELLLYMLLGGIAALIGVSFSKLLYFSEDIWDKIPLKEYAKPVMGGVILGGVGLISPKIDSFPRVFGVGYESITDALSGSLTIQITLALLIFKLLATVVTLGSGGSGGIFAPSLFMGAMLGEGFGQIANQLLPGITAPPGAYALVGMAAVFSSAAHAPITAILILFEMTGDYQIILPLMLATVMSTLVSRFISRESIYTLKLTRRGIHLQYGQDVDLMQSVKVSEVMTTVIDTVPLNMTLEELASEFNRTNHHGFPVVDDTDELAGVVSIQDLKRAMVQGSIDGKTVKDIATTEGVLVAYPFEPMGDALKRLAARDVGRLPVVEETGSRKLVGVIRRGDIIRAYNHAIVKRAQHQQRAEVLKLGKLDSASFMHIVIPEKAVVVGKKVSEVDLPKDCLIVSVRRGRKLFVVHGDTELKSNDRVTVFCSVENNAEVEQILTKTQNNSSTFEDQENLAQPK